VHQEHNARRENDKDYLHHRVVQREKIGEQVQVPQKEHQQVQLLRFTRYAYHGALRKKLPPQKVKGRNVRQVAQRAEEVHHFDKGRV
jgi:hypothetical protein